MRAAVGWRGKSPVTTYCVRSLRNEFCWLRRQGLVPSCQAEADFPNSPFLVGKGSSELISIIFASAVRVLIDLSC